MHLNIKLCSSALLFFVISQSNCAFSAVAFNLKIVTRSSNTIEVERCGPVACGPLEVPKSMADKVAEGFDISSVDIENDGVQEVSAVNKNGNKCAYFYRVIGNKLQEYSPTKNRLCDYFVDSSYIHSRYKNGATWFEDVYVRKDGQISLIAQDRCIGCGAVFRTIYQRSVAIEKKIVSDDPQFSKRQTVSSSVKSAAATLFSAPDEKSATKMYLVNGDSVDLLDYSEKTSGWYQIKFKRSQKKDIVKWVRCSDLMICQNN